MAAKKVKIIFGRGVYVDKNTYQAASVEFGCLKQTNYARSRLSKTDGKARRDFSSSKEREWEETPMYNVLICDDQPDIVNALKIYLAPEGYRLFEAYTGKEALEVVQNNDIHLILLDIMMPVMDGITATARIRDISNAPIILLTAKSETEDKVLGLNVGADDYITKPFEPVEVLARVRSHLRRYAQLGSRAEENPAETVIGGILLNDRTKTVTVEGEPISLTPTEYSILHLLMTHPGEVFSTKALYEAVWQEVALGNESSVAVHIRHLREKIEIDPSEPRYLKVVWGQGYKIEGGRQTHEA